MRNLFNPRIKIEAIEMNYLKIKKDNTYLINLNKVIQEKRVEVRKI
jgi:hypothetical protein